MEVGTGRDAEGLAVSSYCGFNAKIFSVKMAQSRMARLGKRVAVNSLQQDRDRLVAVPQIAQGAGEIDVERDVLWSLAHGRLIRGDRLFQGPILVVDIAQIIARRRQGGVEVNGLLKVGRGLF